MTTSVWSLLKREEPTYLKTDSHSDCKWSPKLVIDRDMDSPGNRAQVVIRVFSFRS